MTRQRVLQFEYQQSLAQESEKPGWSENVTISVRLLSEAITSGWYRERFASRGNDFVILLAIAMHARPLKGDDLKLLVSLHMATSADEGRLYARVSDIALADELGLSRMTIGRATRRLAEDGSIAIVEVPAELTAFRDSHGRFNGTKVLLIAGDMHSRFLEKGIENTNRDTKSVTAEDHRAIKYSKPAPDLRINVPDDEDDEEVVTVLIESIFSYFARRKGSPDYHPTLKEQAALEKLLGDGFTFEQIVEGIEVAFARLSSPRYFTHCAAITRDLVRLQASRKKGTRQPETREPEALEDTDKPPAATSEVVETQLVRAIDVYRSTGREITGDLLARFRLMVARCDKAARASHATGGDWLADALASALGVARPGNLLNYADAVLRDWTANGRNEKPARPPKRNTGGVLGQLQP